jgi:predicted Zn-dependent protease
MSMRTFKRLDIYALSCLALFSAACAAPITQVGSVTREQVELEQLKQQQLVIQSSLKEQERLSDVAAPLLRAAVPLCTDAVAVRMGIRAMNRNSFKEGYGEAARALGFSDTLQLVGVDKGSPADHAGLAVGDRILSLYGQPIPQGRGAVDAFNSEILRTTGGVPFSFLRDSIVRSVVVQRDSVCDYNMVALKSDELNAFADGRQVVVTSAMLRFVADDDELASVLGHEIAHNAMRHIDAQSKNKTMGGILGMLLDVAAATQGVNTQGAYSREFAAAGAMVFSQDFEREADYVGINIMAAAGRNPEAAARLWRRMGQESPGSIKMATTHPTTAERFVRLDQYQREIASRLAVGQPLRLALKNGQQSAALYAVRPVPADAATTQRAVAATQPPSTTPKASTSAASSRSPAQQARSDGQVALTGQNGQSAASARAAPIATNVATGTARPAGRVPQSDDRSAVAIVGAPASDSAAAAAVDAFHVGKTFYERHDWGHAEEWLKKALRLDGSIAEYHAILGAVEMTLGRWEEAEAEYTAASLIDVGNADYRAQILEARRRKRM